MIGTHTTLVYADRSAPVGTPLDVSCLVDEVSIQHGRGGSTDQPEPSAATLDVTVGPGAPLPPELEIGAWLVVATTVEGTTYTRFTGRVTDIALGWDDAGTNTPEAGVGQIVAVSVLADYARRVVGDEPFPQELDGARVARVFALAGLTLDPAYSDPGIVEVATRDIDARNALEVAQGAATSAGGLVWETRGGDVRYADSEHRRGAVVDLDLDACDVLVSPTWSRNLAGLVNEIRIGYGVAPEGGGEAPSWYAVHVESVERFGRYDYSVTTELARELDASAAASLILTQNAYPAWALNALPVSVADLDLARTRTLLGLDVHSLLRVSGLPATGPTPTSIAAWVEGWTERLAWGVHDLEITVSDYCRTAPPPRWNDIAPALTWDAEATTVYVNTVRNPKPNGNTFWDAPAGGAASTVASGGPFGGSFRRVTASGSSTSLYTGTAQLLGVLTSGKTYAASLWLRNSDATHTSDLYVSILNSAGATTRQVRSASVKAGAWTRYVVTFTATALEVGYRMGGAAATAATNYPAGTTLDLGAVMLVEGPPDLPYFDGDTVDTTALGYAWTGTPGASSSRAYTSPSWDDLACVGGPSPNRGLWDDVPASTRWNMVDPALDWDEATGGVPV